MIKLSLFIGIILILLSIFEIYLFPGELDIYRGIRIGILFFLGIYHVLRGAGIIPKHW